MKVHRGEPSVLTAHNQHTQRLNQDKNCKDVFAPIFEELQSTEALDADNKTDLLCLPSRDQSQTEPWKQHSMVIPNLPENKINFNFAEGGGHIRQDLQSLCYPF